MIEIDVQKELQAADGKMMLHIKADIPKGQLITLYGESGAGKTSTLRILAGLMQAEKGEINVNGATWFDSTRKINLRPQERKIGFVFQDYALFPNMTVQENLAFAANKNPKIVADLIEIIELGKLQNRLPATLSGGQQQRVALARALVQQPEILLLDEPLAALDLKIRLKLQDYLLNVHREFKLTTLLISHDIGEIIKLSDQVLVIEQGKIKKSGKAEEIFVNKESHGKFKLTGEVLKINALSISILIQNEVLVINVVENQAKSLSIGDKVLVTTGLNDAAIHRIEG